MFPLCDPTTAQRTFLKRVPPGMEEVPEAVLERIAQTFGERLTPEAAVARIVGEVRTRGDAALREWAAKLDGLALESYRIPAQELRAALEGLPSPERAALEALAARIEVFHRRQPLTSWLTNELGGTLGQLIRPIRRVGLYVPGGTAPLPSSVLMSALPAKAAGVGETVVVSPPQHGALPAITLAACALCGVSEVYAIGGAQAIAALAYGTESIAAVDKIFGPGNLFVTLAKKQVYGAVGIDGLAGPTETMVIADESARPAWVAADLLAQAEHDLLASAILLTPSRPLAEAVQAEVSRQLESLPRAAIAAAALQNRSGVVLTRDLGEALALSNAYGPEHLCLAVCDPWRWAEKVTAAGGVFLGEHSFEVLGDYGAGPSHVMPTSGTARFASPLNVWDFVHIVSLVALDPPTASRIALPCAALARAEGLEAHARAALARAEADG